jgi:hypothetical protein
MIVHMLLEGIHEEFVARALIRHCGHEPGVVYGGKGCGYIRKNAHRFVGLAQSGDGVLVLTDFMDSQCPCPPEAGRQYLLKHCGRPPPSFLCRFAVNELESWLMADREGLASFLRIPVARIPRHPEREPDPKRKLVDLARESRILRLRNALVPPVGHGGMTGPGYTPAIRQFVSGKWSPERAERNAHSLARCIKRLRGLVA